MQPRRSERRPPVLNTASSFGDVREAFREYVVPIAKRPLEIVLDSDSEIYSKRVNHKDLVDTDRLPPGRRIDKYNRFQWDRYYQTYYVRVANTEVFERRIIAGPMRHVVTIATTFASVEGITGDFTWVAIANAADNSWRIDIRLVKMRGVQLSENMCPDISQAIVDSCFVPPRLQSTLFKYV